MTDRVTTLVVTLDKQYREDDIGRIVEALEMVKCVIRVDHVVSDHNYHAAREHVKRDLRKKIFDLL